jgi:hypothetical protein
VNKLDLARRLVADLGKALKLPHLALDERHCCALGFEGSLLVNLEFDTASERLMLSCWLDELPASDTERLLRELLAANFFGHRTQGATLSLEEATSGVVLLYAVPVAETDADAFENILDNFLLQAEHWQQRVRSSSHAGADAWKPTIPAPINVA